MKKSVLITGMLLVFLMAGNRSLEAQRGMTRGMDSTRMNRPDRGMGSMQMRTPGQKSDSLRMNRMHQGVSPIPGHGTMRGMGPGRGSQFGMPRGDRFAMRDMGPGPRAGINSHERFGMRDMGRGPQGGMRMRPGGSGRYGIESIPNLTEKQKSEMVSLRKQQQDEMQKLRDDFSGKMKTMREENRKKLMGLLTDEQKKSLDPPSGSVPPATMRAK
jgi:hypothetical protein